MARILIVDDDAVDRMILEYLLIHEGHELTFVENGAAALDAYARGAFDLVVTDLVMPTLNGLRLIKELRRIDGDAAIIAISGQGADQLLRAQDYGAHGILRKPITRDSLLPEVAAALAKRRGTTE